MDLNYSPEELAFRDEVRGWLKSNLPDELRDKVVNYKELSKDDLLRWHKILAKKGWVAPDWPTEWGGTDWNVVQRYIFEEECGFAGTPPLIAFGLRMCAPVLLRFGTDAQKQRFLPTHLQRRGVLVPGLLGAGLGLGPGLAQDARRARATITTSSPARRSGRPSPTTPTGSSAWCAPTRAPDKRQDGISFLLIDMKTPGITVRPIVLMDGGHEVNEVFFDEVKVPAENLVHEEGKGWTVAKYLLGYERMGTGRIGVSKRELPKLKELAGEPEKDGRPLHRGPALPRPAHARRGRADGARDHQPAVPRPAAPRRQAAGRGGVACSRSRARRSSRRSPS